MAAAHAHTLPATYSFFGTSEQCRAVVLESPALLFEGAAVSESVYPLRCVVDLLLIVLILLSLIIG